MASRMGRPGPAAPDIIERYRDAVLDELRRALEGSNAPPYTLMRYHLGWEDREGRPAERRGGKLLRPALCLLCCEAAGGDWRSALPAGAAIELLHNFTLVHDDVEDASAQRHGRDTLWSVWGAAQAINAGDGLFALSRFTLLRLTDAGHEPERVLRAARMLDEATLRLCEGQHQDLLAAEGGASTRDAYLSMIEGKTASLLAASCAIGALLGGADDATVDALHEFGRRVGLAFQIRDDVLGIWGNEDITGKPSGDDLRSGKRSFPVVAVLERASPEQRAELEALLSAGQPLDSQIDAVCRLLETLGARDKAERAAIEHAEAAVAALGGVALVEERRADLERLARFAAERRA